MEQKINIAELLKDCPNGMELDCTMYDSVTLLNVNDREDITFPIKVLREDGNYIALTKYGQYTYADFAKCVIFPKGETTWEGFVPPCQFKDGDIVATTNGLWIGITTGGKSGESIPTYCVTTGTDGFEAYFNYREKWKFQRLATEEEKQKLFDAIKANGYKWNANTKTLEKLVEPKFKVGDKIRHKVVNKDDVHEINRVYDYAYGITGFPYTIHMKHQDQYELVSDKFDVTTLKPFDKVLVRDNNEQFWTCDWFSFHDTKQVYPFACVGHYVSQCIPYEGNQHLLGTTNDCDEFYKNWE